MASILSRPQCVKGTETHTFFSVPPDVFQLEVALHRAPMWYQPIQTSAWSCWPIDPDSPSWAMTSLEPWVSVKMWKYMCWCLYIEKLSKPWLYCFDKYTLKYIILQSHHILCMPIIVPMVYALLFSVGVVPLNDAHVVQVVGLGGVVVMGSVVFGNHCYLNQWWLISHQLNPQEHVQM